MAHTRPYYDAQEFAEQLHSAMHRAWCESPEEAARVIRKKTGYHVKPEVLATILAPSADTECPLPLMVAIIDAFEPPGGFLYFANAFRPDTMLRLTELRHQREVDGQVA